jgi:hypothetical protein
MVVVCGEAPFGISFLRRAQGRGRCIFRLAVSDTTQSDRQNRLGKGQRDTSLLGGGPYQGKSTTTMKVLNAFPRGWLLGFGQPGGAPDSPKGSVTEGTILAKRSYQVFAGSLAVYVRVDLT